ncbi:MAG: serine hydrolase domain-containing protein [Pseudomonadota bacterium]
MGLSENLRELIDTHDWPGISACILSADGHSQMAAAGKALDGKRLLHATDRVLTASTGKMVTAATGVVLAAKGIVGLDHPAKRYLHAREWWPADGSLDHVTLRTALQHRTGLRDHVGTDVFGDAVLERAGSDPDQWVAPDEAIAIALSLGSIASGVTLYSDANYLIAGLMIEEATGSSLAALAEDLVITPSGADLWPHDTRYVPGLVDGRPDPTGPLSGFSGVLGPDGGLIYHPQTEWAGGGYSGTAEDLCQLVMHLFGARAEPTIAHAMMDLHPIFDRAPGAHYGLGVVVEATPFGPAIGHTGSIPGYRSYASYFPQLDCALAFVITTDAASSSQLCHSRDVLLAAYHPSQFAG